MSATDTATDINQLIAIADKLQYMHAPNAATGTEGGLYTPAHEKVSQRLQKALHEFATNPASEAKSKSLQNAMDNFQTANEILLVKARNALEQIEIDDSNNDDPFSHYGDLFSAYRQA